MIVNGQRIKLEPEDTERFYPHLVHQELSLFVTGFFEGISINEENIQTKTEELTNQTRDHLKEVLKIPRYKLIVQVAIIVNSPVGAIVASKCLWDSNTDNYTQYVYKNEELTCTVIVFGFYNE